MALTFRSLFSSNLVKTDFRSMTPLDPDEYLTESRYLKELTDPPLADYVEVILYQG